MSKEGVRSTDGGSTGPIERCPTWRIARNIRGSFQRPLYVMCRAYASSSSSSSSTGLPSLVERPRGRTELTRDSVAWYSGGGVVSCCSIGPTLLPAFANSVCSIWSTNACHK